MTIPLDPGAGGRSIDSSALPIADIIVSTTSAFVSAIIRAGTSPEVSHSALFIGGDQVVEAIGEGVVLRDLATSLSDDRLTVAYRLPDLTSDQGLKIRDYVGNQLGLPYSVKGALGAGFSYGERKSPYAGMWACAKAGICTKPAPPMYKADKVDTFFCSQLVFAAYQDAGVPITGGRAEDIAPVDFSDLWILKILVYVGHLKA
jgi:uncharacterized protein YycO